MVVILALSGCAGGEQSRPASLTEGEVAAFMRDYEADLRARNREAVIARYDPGGVYVLGDGRKKFLPIDSLAAAYRAGWQGPAFFEFQNLSYETAGDDAMLVLGQFRWADSSAADTALYTYVGLVRRTPAGLRLRIEDESTKGRSP
jgi:hypothetical protein